MSSLRTAIALSLKDDQQRRQQQEKQQHHQQEKQQQQQRFPNGTRVLAKFMEGAKPRDVEGSVDFFDSFTNDYFIRFDDGTGESVEEDIVRTYVENLAKRDEIESLDSMDDATEEGPPSRLSTAAARARSALGTAGSAASRAGSAAYRAYRVGSAAVQHVIRVKVATPFQEVTSCKRRRATASTTTVIINPPRPLPHRISPMPHIPVRNPNTDCVYFRGSYNGDKLEGTWATSIALEGEMKWGWEIVGYDNENGTFKCEGTFQLDDGNGNRIVITEKSLKFTLEKNTENSYNLSGNGSNQFGEYSLRGLINGDDGVLVERAYVGRVAMSEEVVEREGFVESEGCLYDECESNICHEHKVLDRGTMVLVPWGDDWYLGEVLSYDANNLKHQIYYGFDGTVEDVNLASEGYCLCNECEDDSDDDSDEDVILDADEDWEESDAEEYDSDYSDDEVNFVAPSKQKKKKKKKKASQKKKQPLTERQENTSQKKTQLEQTTQKRKKTSPIGASTRNRNEGAFDVDVTGQNLLLLKYSAKFEECICGACEELAADYRNCFATGGEKDELVEFYIQIKPCDAVEFDREFGKSVNAVVAFQNAEKEAMGKFGGTWSASVRGLNRVPAKLKAAAEKIQLTVNGKTYEHMMHSEYMKDKRKAWKKYIAARKKLLKKLVKKGCKSGKEKKELLKLIAGFTDCQVKHDFNIEKRDFQSTYTNEKVDSYIEQKKSITPKAKREYTRLVCELQYAIAFDALTVLMKAAVKPESEAGKLLLRYWKHEIIERYYAALHSPYTVLRLWANSKYRHMKTDEWAKEALQLKFLQPTDEESNEVEDHE